MADPSALEDHYTPAQIAKIWRLDPSTVRKIFLDEEGVLKVGRTSGRGMKRAQYVTLRIPRSVVERVHTERSKR